MLLINVTQRLILLVYFVGWLASWSVIFTLRYELWPNGLTNQEGLPSFYSIERFVQNWSFRAILNYLFSPGRTGSENYHVILSSLCGACKSGVINGDA